MPKWVGWEGVGDQDDVAIIKENSSLKVSSANGHSSSSSSITSTSSNEFGNTVHENHQNGNGKGLVNGHVVKLPHKKVDDHGFDLNTVLGRIKIAGWFLLSQSHAHFLRFAPYTSHAGISLSSPPGPRNIGFSPGLAPSFFHPHPTSRPRREAIRAHLIAAVQSYLALDLILLPFSLHPDFRTIAGSKYGSLYAPLTAAWATWVPTIVSSYFLTFLVGLSLQAVMSLIYHEIALVCVTVSPSETADLYWPPMFQNPTGAASLTELWGKR